jgi:transglutaminase-like putative cysteine protease
MHFQARHSTRYRYSTPVHCEPLAIRLKPRCDFRQHLLRFSLQIDPLPSGLSSALDSEGNDVTTAWFDDVTDELTVTTSFEIETQDVNPFQFLLDPQSTRLPLVPDSRDESFFSLYARPRFRAAEVDELAHELARDADFQTLKFICDLNAWIHAQHAKVVRPHGAAWHPRQTLQEGRGACRDLAVLFLECCRAMNIPCRFVSGYGQRMDESVDHELHAWGEVYLPGAGWRAFDPSLGLAITERHVTAAAGVTPQAAAPIHGTFLGNAASELEAEIEITAIASAGTMTQIELRQQN